MTSKIVTKAISYIEKSTGFYTKKGCIRAATAVGKDLLDLSRAGKELTADEIYIAMSRRVPHVKKPNIAFGRDELLAAIKKANYNELEQRYIMKLYFESPSGKYIGGFFDSGIEGIYLNMDFIKSLPEVIAHELEHYIEFYSNPLTMIKRFFNKLSPSFRMSKKAYDTEIAANLNSEHKEEFIQKEIRMRLERIMDDARLGVQKYIYERFGLGGLIPREVFIKYGFSDEDVIKFLKSDIFTGLSDEKRIDAYLRAILRHYIHPRKNPWRYNSLKRTLEREINAYQTTDNVVRYRNKKECLTTYKVRLSLYKRLLSIIDNEKHIAKSKKGKVPKYRPSLPTPVL